VPQREEVCLSRIMPRSDVQFVVAKFGIADLSGKS
jgi:acyl-CoA hydrolase